MHSASEKKETEAATNKAKMKPTTEHHNLLIPASKQKTDKIPQYYF